MYFTYILYSADIDSYYAGYTSDLEKRLTKHKTNHAGFTGRAKDWAIVYVEEFPDKESAKAKERKIKNWKSRAMIEKLVSSASSAHPDLLS
jgi:putative endonuclease